MQTVMRRRRRAFHAYLAQNPDYDGASYNCAGGGTNAQYPQCPAEYPDLGAPVRQACGQANPMVAKRRLCWQNICYDHGISFIP